jgi:hypothetical protein
MARAYNGGWDFVKVGGQYQYKEDWMIAMVTVLEDNSTDKEYIFKLRVDNCNIEPSKEEFEITHIKEKAGYYSGMMQLFEHKEYTCEYIWSRKED